MLNCPVCGHIDEYIIKQGARESDDFCMCCFNEYDSDECITVLELHEIFNNESIIDNDFVVRAIELVKQKNGGQVRDDMLLPKDIALEILRRRWVKERILRVRDYGKPSFIDVATARKQLAEIGVDLDNYREWLSDVMLNDAMLNCPVCGCLNYDDIAEDERDIGDICSCCFNEYEVDDYITLSDLKSILQDETIIDYDFFINAIEIVRERNRLEDGADTTIPVELAYEVLRRRWINDGMLNHIDCDNPVQLDVETARKQLAEIGIDLDDYKRFQKK